MNPLSPFTYYRRHKRSTVLLLALISLMTLGVSVMVRLPDSFLEHMVYSESVVSRVSLVSALGPSLDPEIVAQIRAHPGVAQVIQERGLPISLPPISGEYHFFGVSEGNMQTLLTACDLHVKEGRLPRPNTNEIVLSESIARGVGKWIGDEIQRPPDDGDADAWFAAIPAPLVVVGILEGGSTEATYPAPPIGIVSYEYVKSHEAFMPIWSPGLVVIAHPDQKADVEQFLDSAITPYARVRIYAHLETKLAVLSRNFHLLFGVVNVLVAMAIALVVSIINQLSQSRRLAEFGMLNAIGFDKAHLMRRVTVETTAVALVGWMLGLGLSWGFFALLKTALYEPNGVYLSLNNLTPIWFSLPIPLTAVAFVVFNVKRTFNRLDAIAIVERDKLSMESDGRTANRSWQRPLKAAVFYLRHRRRGIALIVTISLTLLGVTFPAFIFGPMLDAWSTVLEHLRQVSLVMPTRQATLDPGVMAQIRSQETVQSIIPTLQLEIEIDVPPMAHPSVSLYGVAEDDLRTLLDVYAVHVAQGRLPQPRTNEVVLSKALAQNRGLRVGDAFGRSYNPKEDDEILTDMMVVGILSEPPNHKDLWTGFASLEYLRGHEFYAAHPEQYLVIPDQAQKQAMDTWLLENVASSQTSVLTFDRLYGAQRIGMYAFMIVFGILESVIAIVAAVALAILSYTFFIQRKDEFGVLHALGHQRRKLVWRTFGESTSAVGIAWLLGAGLCLIGLLGMQIWLYAPKGFTVNVFNPIPWLFTIPLPIATITVGTMLIARMLRKLDPVAVIERRA